MTINEISNQLYNLSVGHYFNGEKFTKTELKHYISNMLRTSDRVVMEITLMDGRWYFTVDRFANRKDGYDYYIPDTREHELLVKEYLRVR